MSSLLNSHTYLHPSLTACGLLGIRKHPESLQKRNYFSWRKTTSEYFHCLREHLNTHIVLSSWFADIADIVSTQSPSAHQNQDSDKKNTQMSHHFGKLGSPVNAMEKWGYSSLVECADLTTDTVRLLGNYVNHLLLMPAQALPLPFIKLMTTYINSIENQWQWLLGDLIFFLTVNEETAQQITNENKNSIQQTLFTYSL